MLDSKTKNDILIEEKVAKIDDINFDKIYDIDEFATKQLETFEEKSQDLDDLSTKRIEEIDDIEQEEKESKENNTAFELELQPNEFLDNMVWGEDEEIEEVNNKKHKFSLQNKPLFYTFTSIAILLCILFIYNVFVINSLEKSVAQSVTPSNSNSNTIVVEDNQNNLITFDNGNSTEIENSTNYITPNKNIKFQTNWFNQVCNFLNQLFGGSY